MKKLICLGDSITAANRLFCSNCLGEGFVSMLPPLLPDFQIINKGVDGFTVSRILQNIQQSCIRLRPDWITVQVGINNIGLMMNANRTPAQQKQILAECVLEYTELLNKITKRAQAEIVLMEPFILPCPQEFANWVPHVKELSGHIRELADIFGCKFLPLHDLMNQEARRTGYAAVSIDGIHPTAAGHGIIARRLSRILI